MSSQSGAISGTLFADVSGNNVFGGTDVGLADVAVSLLDTTGAVLASTTTDSSGSYSFAGLAPGSYFVQPTPPAGFVSDVGTPLPVTVGTQGVTGQNAGFYQNAQVVGFVEDGSGNVVDGITVNLIDATGAIVATTISTAQFGLPHGVYYFPTVKPGVYTVQTVLVSGTVTAYSTVSTGQLTGGQFLEGLTVTLPPPPGGYITGTVFFDGTGNDVFGGVDIGLSGVTVSLLNASGTQVATTTTSSVGTYAFAGLADGVYSVTFGSPAGTPITTIYGTLPSDITNNETNNTQHVSITGGQTVTEINAGYSFSVTIQGFAFNDVNGNGTFTAGDALVAGETVTLLDGARDQVGQTQTTGADGVYSFTNIPQGPYTLEFTAPTGTELTTPVLDYVGVIAGGQSVTVNSGSVTAVGSISVSGTVFTDTNGDSQQDAGETGLAGVNLLLLKDAGTPNATALRTTVTGADGSYSFSGLPAGNYSVVVSTPEGLTGTSATTASVGALVSGQSGTANFGFATNPSPDVTPPPASTTINIILRGQSNAQYFVAGGYLNQLQQDVETLLGFNGTSQVVNILGDYGKANGDNTINSGTGMTADWLSQNAGGYTNGWTAKNLELGLLSDIAQQSAAFKAAPTAVVWLHNESDSDVAGLTTPEWQSAAEFEAGLVRGLLGQGASSVPYMFVDAIPFIPAFGVDQADNDSNDQAIKIGMYGLADDPAFGGSIAAQSADVNMDHDGSIGGAHLDAVDDANLVYRLAQSIAAEFSSSALPGSPVALANGQLDNLGPQVVYAETVASNANQLLLTITQDHASGFEALDAAAAAGVGWSIRNTADGSSLVLEASGTAVQIIDGTHLLVTFDQPVPTNGLLFYSWGSARLAANPTLPGQDNAVYDTNNLPIWTDPNGVAITAASSTQPGSISGFAYFDANGNAVFDTGDTALPALTVNLLDSSGAMVATTTTGADGSFTFTGVQPGSYSVVFPAVSGTQTSGATGSQTVDVTSGQTVTGIDGGFYIPGTILGIGFVDAAGTGQYAGTGGVDGEQVQLLNASGRVIATTTTSNTNATAPGVDGLYSFTSLAPGSYSVQFAPPAGDVLTSAALVPVTLNSQSTDVDVNSILAPAATGSVAGTAFLDANGNGTQESGETGIAGVTVTLTSPAGATLATTTTDSSGNYTFTGLAAGTDTVSFSTPSGDSAEHTAPLSVSVISGQTVTNTNAPFYVGAAIAGFVEDASGTPVDGVTVNLMDSTGAVVATMASGPNFAFPHGVYEFQNVKPGTYSIQAVVSGGQTQPTFSTGVVTGGQNLFGFNINLSAPPPTGPSISGTVFNDANLNTIQDSGEAGIAGDLVTLINAAGATVAVTTTDSTGAYDFTGLTAGSYSVGFATPGGFLADHPAPVAVALTAQGASNEDAGFYQPAAIAGFVFADTNGDGVMDGAEPALDGITVNLINSSGVVVATTTTGPYLSFPHGVYIFNNVEPGTYTVQAFGTGTTPVSTGPLTSGQNLFGFNIAVKDTAPVGTGSISGTAFVDANGGTTIAVGDAGLANETVTLLSSAGTPLASVATDATGNYGFTNLSDGSYSVSFTQSSGYAANAAAAVPVTIVDGQAVTGVNSGSHAAVTIQGLAFVDSDQTGQFVTGETLVNGVTVTLLNFNHDPVGKTVTANLNGANGAYTFTDVAPGAYTVRFDAPSGEVLTTPTLNSLGTLTAGQSITLNSGMISSAGTIEVSGTTFSDTNGDGTQDAGERGLAGVTVLLMKDAGTPNATAVKTLVTDADGGYAFTGLAPGNYSVVVATPEGLASTSPTSVSVGALATGQSETVNVGFTANPSPAVTPVLPSTTLNIVLIGQSNAQNIANPALSPGLLASMQSQLEQLLGFDGTNQKVNILAEFGKADGDNTINSGTGLTTDWLSQINGSYTNGWSANNLELGYLSDLAQQSASFQAAPTAIVMLHNEADSNNPNLTLGEWESAVQFEAGLTRAVLGQSASSVPWLFVNAIPFPGGGSFQDSNEQTIRIGQAALSADPTFGGTVAAQASDITENEFGTPPLGGHLNLQDRTLVVSRLVQTLADTFASSALPGSPIALANGHIDDKGPQVVSAQTVAASPDQLLITVKQDTATAFEALDAVAALGVGWSIRNTATGASSVLEASGTAAQIVDGTHLLVTFDQAIPAAGLLFYAYGQGLIAQPGQSGYGNAVYDTNNLPISVDPNGLSVTSPDTTPPVVTASATAATMQATSAAGAVETFAASAIDAVDGTDPVVFTEQLAGGATKVVQSGGTFAIGTHTIVASATDAAGNTGSAAPFSFSVVDTAAPVVTASADAATVQATSAAGAVETFTASASDIVDGTDPVVFTEQLAGGGTKVVQSGGTFAIGTHTIVASATDSAALTGSTTFNFTITPLSSQHGIAEDGYISGATVFADANGNGVLDPGEATTTTDANGNFTLAGGSGPLVLVGGTDITTGLAFTGALQAPSGSTVVSPLTTIVQIVASTQGISSTAANASVTESLGLPTGTNLTTLDAESGAMAGGATATAVFAAQTQVANTFSLITASGGSVTSSAAASMIASAFTSGTPILTNATALTAFATSLGVGSAAAASVGQIGSAANALIATTATDGSSAASTVATIAAVATVAQGAASTALANAVANPGTLAATTAAYTGGGLVQATTQAGGTLSAPSVALDGAGGTISTADTMIFGTVDLADASGTLQLYENGTAIGSPVSITPQGTFSTDLTFPGNGVYAVTATKSNAAGDVGVSNAVSFTVNSAPNESLFGSLTHDVTSAGGSVYALYETILGRAPDPTGFETAVAAVQAGVPLTSIAQGMLSSPEYAGDYGASVQSDGAFVNQIYADGLHRQAEPGGLQTWTQALGTGQLTRAQVAVDIATSAESQGDLAATFQSGVFVPSATDSSIARLYYGLLDRAPDAGGLQTWEGAVASGLSLTQVAQDFLGSAEYQTTAVGQSNLQFVDGLYQTALGRTGETAGVQLWETALDSGTLTHADVVSGFLGSAEFQADTAGDSPDAYINQVYQVALGRTAEPAGLQTWETAFASGLSRTAFDQDVVASAEFQANTTSAAQSAFVNALYEGALGRAAEPGGLAVWQSQLTSGSSAASVALGIAESPEAQAHLVPKIEAGFHVG